MKRSNQIGGTWAFVMLISHYKKLQRFTRFYPSLKFVASGQCHSLTHQSEVCFLPALT